MSAGREGCMVGLLSSGSLKRKSNIVRGEDVNWGTYPNPSEPRDRVHTKTLITRDRCGSKDLTMGILDMPPGDVHILHRHEGVSQAYYVVGGKARITIGEETVNAEPGLAIYIPAGMKHRIDDIREKLFIVWVANAPDFVNRYEEITKWDE